jgi:hypothetical protein
MGGFGLAIGKISYRLVAHPRICRDLCDLVPVRDLVSDEANHILDIPESHHPTPFQQ